MGTSEEIDVVDRAKGTRRPTGVSGLRTLEVLAMTPDGLGVSDLADAIGLDVGQTHRLLRYLEEEHWVVQGTPRGPYKMTGRLLSIAGQLLRRLDLRDIARPALHKLQASTNETVGLVELRGEQLICIDRLQSDQHVRVVTQIGDIIALDGTATGAAVQAAWLRRADIGNPHTPHPPLSASVKAALDQGYAIDDRGYNLEVRAVAAAVLNLQDVPVGAIFVVAPAARVSLSAMDHLGTETAAAAAEISEALGQPRST